VVFKVDRQHESYDVSGSAGFGFPYEKIDGGGRPFLNVQFRWSRGTKERWGPPETGVERRWARVKLDTGCDAVYAHPDWLVWNGVAIHAEGAGVLPNGQVFTASGEPVVARITSGTMRVQGFENMRIQIRKIYYSRKFPEGYALISHNVLVPYFGIIIDRSQTVLFSR
jgi:hypothetical protein